MNSTAASSTPPAWRFQSGAPASTQSPQAGKKIRSAGLLRPVRPQSNPKSAQRPRVSSGTQAQCHHQHPGEQKGSERCVPHPADRILHGCRVEGPDPRRPPGHVAVEAACGDLPGGTCRQGRKQAVDGQNHPRRLRGEDAEQLEDPAQKQRKERSHPRGRAGVPAKRISEAEAGGQRASDPPHLLAKQHVVVVRPDAVGMRQGEVKHAHRKGHPEDRPGRTRIAFPAGWGGALTALRHQGDASCSNKDPV